MRKLSHGSAIALLIWLLAVNVYRAATQSLTHDEALTWLFYLAGSPGNIFAIGEPNNHLLATLLMRLSTTLLGNSELAIRLTSLVAGALYFYVIYALALSVFGEGLLFFLTVALLSLNPLMLDFLVAARGYGPAVAFYFLALYVLLRYRTSRRYDFRLLYVAGISLSCAVMANMSLFSPALVTAAVFCATLSVPEVSSKARQKRGQGRPAPYPSMAQERIRFLLPVVFLAALFLAVNPVKASALGSVYRLPGGFVDSIFSLIVSSMSHNQGLAGLNRETAFMRIWQQALAFCILPAVVIVSLWLSLRCKRTDASGLLLLWASSTIAGSMLLHVVAARLWNLPYPADRTGLVYIPLTLLTVVTLAKVLRVQHGRMHLGWIPMLGLAVSLTVQYAIQFQWNHFYCWIYDADNKAFLEKIRTDRTSAGGPLHVGVSWQLAPSLEYYRLAKHLEWLAPVTRQGPEGEYDYYLLLEQDRIWVERKGLKVMYEGPVSRTILAKPGRDLLQGGRTQVS